MSVEARCTTERLRADADHLLRLVHGQANDFWELLAVVGRISARVGRLEAMMAKSGSASSAPAAELESAPAASVAAGNSPAVPVSSEQTPRNPELPTG